MTFEECFTSIKEYLSKLEDADLNDFGDGEYTYQFNLTGEAQGVFFLKILSGIVEIQPFDYKGCLCSFTADPDILTEILQNNLSPVTAYCSGRLVIRGDTSVAFLLADALKLNF